MVFDRMFCMLSSVNMMAMRQVGMMRCLLMIARFVMGGGFFVVARSVLMVFRCLVVMVGCFLGHSQFPFTWKVDC